jgi:hypothetical protein
MTNALFAGLTIGKLGGLAALGSGLWAYLDPGTGSFFLQMLIAGALSGMFVMRQYWQRFRSLVFSRARNSE